MKEIYTKVTQYAIGIVQYYLIYKFQFITYIAARFITYFVPYCYEVEREIFQFNYRFQLFIVISLRRYIVNISFFKEHHIKSKRKTFFIKNE